MMANRQVPEDYSKVIFHNFRQADREADVIEQADPLLKGGGGGGTSDGMSSDWKESVNGQLTQLHSDVRKLLAGIIALAILGCGLYASLAYKLEVISITQATLIEKSANSEKQLDRIEGKIDQLGGSKSDKN